MVVATGVSGAIIYYSRGGSSPAIGTNLPAVNGLSGTLSDAQLANLTSALGGVSNPATSNLTSALGELSGALSNSTLANFTVALGGQVVVGDSSFPAEDFTASGTTTTFTCAASPSAAYLTLTDNGTGSASVASISIASVGGITEFAPSGACDITTGAGAITYIMLPATSQISPSAVSGSYYAGVVTLSDGSQIPFEGTWQ